MPTLIWASGWEHGKRPVAADIVPTDGLVSSVIGEDATNLVVDATAARTGSYGLRINKNGVARAVEYAVKTSSGTILVGSGYFRLPSLPAGTQTDLLFVPQNAGGGFGLWYDATAGKFEAQIGGGTVVQSTLTPVANQWYRLDFRVDLSANPLVLDWQLGLDDGVGVDQPQATGAIAATSTRWITLGYNSVATVDIHFDDWVASETSADYPLGAHGIRGFTVDQAAAAEHQAITLAEWQYTDDFSAFTSFASQVETDSRSRIDDLTSADGIRMNAAAAVAGNARWKLAAPSGLPGVAPWAVQAIALARESAAGTNNATLRLYSGGSVANIYSGSPAWGTTWNFLRAIFLTNPSGASWTDSDIDGLRLEVDSTDAAPEIWLGGVHFEVVQPVGAAAVGGRNSMMLLGVG